MRIAILQSTSPSSFSMKVYARNVAEGLRTIHPEWDIVSLSPMIPSPSSGGSVSNAIDKYYKRYWYYPLSFRQQTADIFHVVDHSDGHLIPWLKRFGKTVVITCHDLINLVQPQMYSGLSLAPMISLNTWRWSVQKMKQADHVITVSSHTANDVTDQLQIDPAFITTVPNAVSSTFHPTTREEIASLRQQLNLSPETFCILNVGSNNPRKNVSTILDVIRILKERQQPVHFWKMGSDFSPQQYEFIATYDLGEHVSYLGKPDDSTLINFYSAADVLLAPSLYEGFGLTVLEAMACGTPVVTSNVSSLPEVAGDAAILVDPNDSRAMVLAVEGLIRDDRYRHHLIDQGLKRVQKFTWINTAKQIAEVYEHVHQSTS